MALRTGRRGWRSRSSERYSVRCSQTWVPGSGLGR
jgi:hypothetical protein